MSLEFFSFKSTVISLNAGNIQSIDKAKMLVIKAINTINSKIGNLLALLNTRQIKKKVTNQDNESGHHKF